MYKTYGPNPLIIPATNSSNTEQLEHFPPEANGGIDEARLIGVNNRTFPDEIRFVWLDDLGSLDDLPNNEERWDEELHRVAGEEGRD